MIKNVDITLKERKFDATDPILIFDFLARFHEEWDTLKMSERRALVELPHFHKWKAELQYRASANSAGTGRVSSWSEAVQYLLRTYDTTAAIRQTT